MTEQQEKFKELWVRLEDGQAMCALINGAQGWLMYLREDGDAGYSSRNPSYDGPEDATIEYALSNGQHDEYPASWALPTPDITRALEEFKRNQKPPHWIQWHNDADDGKEIPYHPRVQ